MSGLRSAAFAPTVGATKLCDFSDIPGASTDRRTRLAPGLGIVAPSPETSHRYLIADIKKCDRADHNEEDVLDSTLRPGQRSQNFLMPTRTFGGLAGLMPSHNTGDERPCP